MCHLKLSTLLKCTAFKADMSALNKLQTLSGWLSIWTQQLSVWPCSKQPADRNVWQHSKTCIDMFCSKPSSFPFRYWTKPPKLVHVSQIMKISILRFPSPLEQEASFTPRPCCIGPLTSWSSLGEFTSRCLPQPSTGPDVMPISWAAKHSERHLAPRETSLESSSISARRKYHTALSSFAALSQRASC